MIKQRPAARCFTGWLPPQVTVYPAHTPASTVLEGGFDGVMLSNGPGDPADNVEIIGPAPF